MIPKLPFLTAPVPETEIIGDRITGTLQILRLGDLTPNERIYIKEQTKHLPDLRTEAVKMAKIIATSTQKPLAEVFTALTSLDTVALSENIDSILKLKELIDEDNKIRPLVMTTAIIRFRVNREWTLEDTYQLAETSPRLVSLIAEFGTKEENGDIAPIVPPTEESLEKPSAQMQPNPTGQEYSGNVQEHSPTIPDSVPVILETSPVG